MNERSILFYWWLDRTNAEDLKAAEGRTMLHQFPSGRLRSLEKSNFLSLIPTDD
jgi:hypothetical protein